MSAWPASSNAITTTAAPYLFTKLACFIKISSPSFKEIELTIGLPCMHLRADSIISHLLESIITGTFEISGSPAIKFKNLIIAASESSIPSSILISMI